LQKGYTDVLKYFKKAENLDPHRNEFDPDAHGRDGPLHVTELGLDQVNERTPLFVDSCANATKERKVDIPKIGDYNSTQGNKGISLSQVTTYKGVREDTWTAYMKRTGAATERPNLDITTLPRSPTSSRSTSTRRPNTAALSLFASPQASTKPARPRTPSSMPVARLFYLAAPSDPRTF
jgi:hypothetical protein